jgi:hypothetical protein
MYNPQKIIKREVPRKYSEISGKGGEYGLIEKGEEFMRFLIS